jgi:hypothetical protein
VLSDEMRIVHEDEKGHDGYGKERGSERH